MEKDYLLYLKKIAVTGGVISGLGLLTGCSFVESDGVLTEDIEDQKQEEIGRHDHIMLKIGDTNYIFRECDENIGDIKTVFHNGSVGYTVYDSDDVLIINAKTYGDFNWTSVSSDRQEEEIRAIEERAIENGAILYEPKHLGRKK